jgi:hypothetical protein
MNLRRRVAPGVVAAILGGGGNHLEREPKERL